MSKTAKIVLAIVVVVIVVIIWIGASQKSANSGGIKIGAVLPLSGPAASYGQVAKDGVELAVAKILKTSNVNLKVIYEDSQFDPKQAVTAIQKLINVDGVKYVVGFSSGETLAMCPIADENKVILMTSASSPDITSKCGDYTFRDLPSDTYQGQVLASDISAKGYQKVAVFYIDNDYGVGLKNEFVKDFKGTITDVESYEPNATDFKTQLTKIKASKPDAIMLVSQLPEAAILLEERTELGLSQPVFGSETLKDPNLFKTAPASLKNLYITYISQYNGPEFQNYASSYQQKYGTAFGSYSDYLYDDVLVLGDAIAKCNGGGNVDCVKEQIYKTNITGATGPINFDGNGDRINKDYTLYKVENNDFVPAD